MDAKARQLKNQLPKNVVTEINYLVGKYKLVLLEFKKGYLHLLFNHHRYLDPWKDAPRSKICKSPTPTKVHFARENFLYITNEI